MAEPVSRTEFAETMRDLRASIEKGFDDLGRRFDTHEIEDRAVADRVLVIETQRASEATQAAKHGTIAALLATLGINGVIAAAKAYFGR